MKRPRPIRSALAISALALALTTFFVAISAEFLVFRLEATESGLFCECLVDYDLKPRVEIVGPRGRFWCAPDVSLSRLLFNARFPHWCIIGLALAGLLLPDGRRRTDDPRCPACGYNLTGNLSGTCSECGAAEHSAGND